MRGWRRLWSTRAQSEVFPLDFEPILREDGAQKNGRERSAAKRLCQALGERYHDLSILLVEDALFANAPHLRQITGYVSLVKTPSSLISLAFS